MAKDNKDINTNNLVLITTYIGSGVNDNNFLDQRINILKYSTIPSLVRQSSKNFVWLVYLDEFNTNGPKIHEMCEFLKQYMKHIKIHICKHKPILKNDVLCIDNRARSCSSKKHDLYLQSLDYCEQKGYLKNINYVSHMMLDDDDPIRKTHIGWINNKVKKYHDQIKDKNGMIVINRNQYIFYLNNMTLATIKSKKAMKGSGFVFYDIKNIRKIRFHPYAILETLESNKLYLEKYNISTNIVEDSPTWIYFRHHVSTSSYRKEFIIDNLITKVIGVNNVKKILGFYNKTTNLEKLSTLLKAQHRSSDIINWKIFRYKKRKNLLFVIDNITKYPQGLKLCNFLSNNFNVSLMVLNAKDRSHDLVKNHWNVLKDKTIFNDITINKGIDRSIMQSIEQNKGDHILLFGDTPGANRMSYHLNKKYAPISMFNKKKRINLLLGSNVRDVNKWDTKFFAKIYELLIMKMVLNVD
jgi:hypothetical protein